jgi:hypothetical protein
MEKKQLCKGCRKFKHIDQFEPLKKQCLYCRKAYNNGLANVKRFIQADQSASSDMLPFGGGNQWLQMPNSIGS